METFFAPARRTERRQFKNQITTISRNPIMDTLLKTAAGLLVVLNEDRQIVAMNHSFLQTLGIRNVEKALGLRIGESLHCVHAFDKPAGCGTTEHCASCGAAIAIMTAINEDRRDEQICALVSDRDGTQSDICLLIKAEAIKLDQNRWILVYAQDITQEQFWANLDRVFFHDINNSLTALYGNVQLVEMDQPDNPEIVSLRQGIEQLISEVDIQKKFAQHKDASYTPSRSIVSLKHIRKDLERVISGHAASRDKEIQWEWPAQDLPMETDALLVSRVLTNMVINALEATPARGAVGISATISDRAVTWDIRNAGEIPPAVQKRIFQRHFSSKPGRGRGLGTYSMKLFGEKYLKGKISFESSPETGTRFSFCLPLETL